MRRLQVPVSPSTWAEARLAHVSLLGLLAASAYLQVCFMSSTSRTTNSMQRRCLQCRFPHTLASLVLSDSLQAAASIISAAVQAKDYR